MYSVYDYPFNRSKGGIIRVKKQLLNTLEELVRDESSFYNYGLVFRIQVYHRGETDELLNYLIKYLSSAVFDFIVKRGLHLKFYEFQFIQNKDKRNLEEDNEDVDGGVGKEHVRLIIIRSD